MIYGILCVGMQNMKRLCDRINVNIVYQTMNRRHVNWKEPISSSPPLFFVAASIWHSFSVILQYFCPNNTGSEEQESMVIPHGLHAV